MDVTHFNGLTYSRFDYCNTIVLAVDYDGNSYEEHVGCCTGNALHADDFQSIQDKPSPISCNFV